MNQPLILTLKIDDAAQAFYEGLRDRYFPAERNLIRAHLTLFHQLPDEDSTIRTLREVSQATSDFPLSNPKPRSIGRGVAVFFESAGLKALHATLAAGFDADLIPQDRQRFQPHIVVQNKVHAETGRATLAQLQVVPMMSARASGLTLWRYLGGPWEHITDLPFAHPTAFDASKPSLQ